MMEVMKVSSVLQMRNMDRRAIEEFGIPDTILMENAGNAVSGVIFKTYQDSGVATEGFSSLRFAVFSGSGNNGGDGFVVARKLFSFGANVRVFFLGSVERLSGSALANYEILKKIGMDIVKQSDFNSLENFLRDAKAYLITCDGIVDAILGTGITREVSGLYGEVIDLINRFGKGKGKPVFSVDIPSGVNGDTGMVMGKAVKATHTVTFGLAKLGNILYPGYEYCGELYVTHISFPPSIYNDDSLKVEINIPSPLPSRNPNGHKGSFGDVLFVAGAKNYYGAPLFSALSFMKAGGGYARLATPDSVAPFLSMRGGEIVMLPMEETDTGSIAYSNLEKLLDVADGVDFVVIGPGLSLNNETVKVVRDFVAKVKKPVLIDGDGLTALAMGGATGRVMSEVRDRKTGDTDISVAIGKEYPIVLTPHPGEAARLTGMSVKDVISDKPKTLDRLLRMGRGTPVVVVLKGAHSLIGISYAERDYKERGRVYTGDNLSDNGMEKISVSDKVFVNLSGNSGMATAGSGDVLTGIIAAMFGLGLDVVEAVKAGVFIHGFAGDIAARHVGEDSLTASTLVEFIPEAVRRYRKEYDELFKEYYGCIRVV